MSRSMDGWLPKRALCSQCAVNIRASAQWGEMPVYGDVDLFVRREVSILDPYLVQALLVLRRCHALPTLDWGIIFLFKTIIWVPEIRKEFFLFTIQFNYHSKIMKNMACSAKSEEYSAKWNCAYRKERSWAAQGYGCLSWFKPCIMIPSFMYLVKLM